MGTGIVSAVVLALTGVLMLARWWIRLKSERRKLADEAQKQLKEGLDTSDTSSITASFDRMRRAK